MAALTWLLVLDFAGSPVPDALQQLFGKLLLLQRGNTVVEMRRANRVLVLQRQ
jgi:hypothetical protein